MTISIIKLLMEEINYLSDLKDTFGKILPIVNNKTSTVDKFNYLVTKIEDVTDKAKTEIKSGYKLTLINNDIVFASNKNGKEKEWYFYYDNMKKPYQKNQYSKLTNLLQDALTSDIDKLNELLRDMNWDYTFEDDMSYYRQGEYDLKQIKILLNRLHDKGEIQLMNNSLYKYVPKDKLKWFQL